MTGKLYLIPTGLGDNAPLEILPISIKKIIESIDVYIVENEKAARKFIKSVSSGKSQPSLTIHSLNKFTDPLEIPSFLEECLDGSNVGLLSDAGCPGVADPGADVVKIAHKKNIKVIPLVGPSSILLAIMSSGMNGQNFAFNGYLPIEKDKRKTKIKQLEKRSLDENQSQLFIETPYRNNSVLEDLYKTLNADTKICVACDLTLATEYIKTQTAKQWKHSKLDIHKRPAIFIIHKD
tara:strand:+ start:74 stop:781 length:708 start_codon:yes stop_codon:yes gene_type:complete